MRFLLNNRQKCYPWFLWTGSLDKTYFRNLELPCPAGHSVWSPLTFLPAGKDGGSSALLQAWCFPAPAAGPCMDRGTAAGEPADGNGLEVISLEVRVVSGGLGAWMQHQIQPLTCYVPCRRCCFMDVSHGRASSGSSVSLPLPPIPLPKPAGHFVETPQHDACTGYRGWPLHNTNEWYGGQPKLIIFFNICIYKFST